MRTLLAICLLANVTLAADDLAKNFATPPSSVRGSSSSFVSSAPYPAFLHRQTLV